MRNILKLMPLVLAVSLGISLVMEAATANTFPEEEFDIDSKNYLVKHSGKANSPITLIPHHEVSGVVADVAGQSNSDMAIRTSDTHHILAILDWPKNAEGRMMTVIARFDGGKFDVPSCAQAVNLIKDDRYFYPQWKSMKVKSLSNSDYLIAVHAAGRDSDGEGSSGWDMIAFLKLSPSCKLSVLHRESTEWASGPDNTGCIGYHPDYHFLSEKTAEIGMTTHTCSGTANPQKRIIRKKIKLGR